MTEKLLTKRRYKDGDHAHLPWVDEIFTADASHKCPTYVHRTPPCQGSCPSGEDIRGWLNIVRGIEKPPEGTEWQKYAFEYAPPPVRMVATATKLKIMLESTR